MNVAQFEHAECCLCGEKLSDPESVRRGTGPVCAAKLTSFLAAVGSSTDEIAALAMIDDATVARWLRIAARAIQEGHYGRAERFLESARKAAAAAVARAETVEAAA